MDALLIMKKVILLFICLLMLVAGCAPQVMEQGHAAMEEDVAAVDWKNAELTDVLTGNKFMISGFEGKHVLLESFAVWCPTCKRQQDEIKKLHDEVGDAVVSISLDTDPNEDEAKVTGHANRYGYDWIFAVSPAGVTRALIEEFTVSIVNAPGAPVVLICGGQSARMLGSGVKSADKLKSEIETC